MGILPDHGCGCDRDYIVGKLGNAWSAVDPGVSIKPYPCGSLAHPAMDAARDLILENDIKPDHVKELRFGTTSRVLEPLRYKEPQNELEAKFSLQFGFGILLLERAAGIAQYKDEVVSRPDVVEMMKKINPFMDDEIEAQGYALIRGKVAIELEDGTVYEKNSEISRGTPSAHGRRTYENSRNALVLFYGGDQIALIEAMLYKIDTPRKISWTYRSFGEKVNLISPPMCIVRPRARLTKCKGQEIGFSSLGRRSANTESS